MNLFPNKFGITAFLAATATVTAAEPAWWASRNVITADPVSNFSPATVGQAKWMALQAKETLQSILPDVASQIDGDLTGGNNPILQNGWAVPLNPDENLAVLTIGQLKAIAHPFHARLSAAVGNPWMNDHLLSRGLPANPSDPGVLHHDFLGTDGIYYPWKLMQSPENLAMANIGQLKLCFDLPLTEDLENPPDGLPDLWEYAVVHANPTGGTWTDIGMINAANVAQAAADAGMTGPPATDTPIDKSNWEAPDWSSLTGDGAEDQPITNTRTFTIKKGKSRIVVVGMVSEEYPYYTGGQSEWNDQLEWEITPSVGDAVEGSLDVNTLHNEWDIANFEGTTLNGFSPAHVEKIAVIHAAGEADVIVTVKLTITNIGDDILPSTLIVGLIPVEVVDNRFATGVDNVSKTADSSDIGYQKDFWIMAPSGTVPLAPGNPGPASNCENDTEFFIPLDNSIDLVIDADKATPNPDTIPLITEDNPSTTDNDETLNKITWHGTSTESGENVIGWEFGSNEPEENLLPIKVMTMKNRNVKVICYMVSMPGYSDYIVTCGEALLEATLNKVFAWQINAWFDVVIKTPTVYSVDYDLNDNLWMNPSNADGTTSSEAAKIIEKVPRDNSGDIHVYFTNFYPALSSTPPKLPGEEGSAGIHAVTPKDGNNVFVGPSTLPTDVERTIMLAHEIGHVLCGGGHPDQGSGDAPLAGTNRLKRLMYSHIRSKMDAGTLHQNLLVKKEWDHAEGWLGQNIDNQNP